MKRLLSLILFLTTCTGLFAQELGQRAVTEIPNEPEARIELAAAYGAAQGRRTGQTIPVMAIQRLKEG